MPETTASRIAYFNAGTLPKPSLSYVCWLDVMGASSVMERSISMAANFVCKLHHAVLQSPHEGIRLYPMIDGLYAISDTQSSMKAFLTGTFTALAQIFVGETVVHHRFVPKASIAYGPVLHGETIPASASPILAEHTDYRKTLMFGMPMIQAYNGERCAPPFGVYIHESARAFAGEREKPFICVWWQWFDRNHDLATKLNRELKRYYEWCKKNPHAILYEVDRINEHEQFATEYFVNLQPELGQATA